MIPGAKIIGATNKAAPPPIVDPIRLANLYIEVIRKGPSEVRVGQIYIEVIRTEGGS